MLPAFPGEEIEVRNWISESKRVRAHRRYEFIRKSDGKVIAKCDTDWVYVDAKTGRPIAIPADVTEFFPVLPDKKIKSRCNLEVNMPKIMVVDDDEDFTALYKQSLEMAGFDAIVENHSSMAMEVAHSKMPDLFVLDLMMPAPDGFQLCRMLRADSKFQHTPIIIITALTDLDSKIVAMGAGANDYLVKPFHIKDLKSRINALLERLK